jgi:hypothetical protein
MRRGLYAVIAFATSLFVGCSWSHFWGSVFDNVNGDSYRTDYSTNRDYDFRQRYEQQAKLAEEYRQQE